MPSSHPLRTIGQILFSFRGRISRRTFIWSGIIIASPLLLLPWLTDRLSLLRGVAPLQSAPMPTGWLFAAGLAFIVFFWISLALPIKRLHDRDHSGWMVLVLLVPFVSLWPIFEMNLLRGTNGPNQFGDAPISFRGANFTDGVASATPGWGAFVIDLFCCLIPITTILLLRVFYFEPFYIPSGSNIPTLLVGDYIVVSKSAYGYGRFSFPLITPNFSGRIFAKMPERGDMVVFRKPTETSVDFVKRVVGLPGDRIQVLGGLLYINGTPVQRQQIDDFNDQEYGASDIVRQFIETLPGGRQHRILQKFDDGDLDNTGIYVVPPNHLFVMGDNRDNSMDSRVLSEIGYVPLDNLVGKAEFFDFSLDTNVPFWDLPAAIRYSRLFTRIQ